MSDIQKIKPKNLEQVIAEGAERQTASSAALRLDALFQRFKGAKKGLSLDDAWGK